MTPQKKETPPGPLITTVNDLVAVVIYYGLSWLLLLNVLHLG